MFYLVTTCICIMICGVSSYAIDRANQGLVTIPVVVADVEFQNIMTAKYIVGDQQYEHREKVSPKYVRPIGSKTFLRYDVSCPTYARFTIYSAPWVEVAVTSLGWMFVIVFIAFACRMDRQRLSTQPKRPTEGLHFLEACPATGCVPTQRRKDHPHLK